MGAVAIFSPTRQEKGKGVNMNWFALVAYVMCYLSGLAVMWAAQREKHREFYDAGYNEGYKDAHEVR